MIPLPACAIALPSASRLTATMVTAWCVALEAWAASALASFEQLEQCRLVAALAAALLLGAVLIAKLLAQRVPSIVVEPITGGCLAAWAPLGLRALHTQAQQLDESDPAAHWPRGARRPICRRCRRRRLHSPRPLRLHSLAPPPQLCSRQPRSAARDHSPLSTICLSPSAPPHACRRGGAAVAGAAHYAQGRAGGAHPLP